MQQKQSQHGRPHTAFLRELRCSHGGRSRVMRDFRRDAEKTEGKKVTTGWSEFHYSEIISE